MHPGGFGRRCQPTRRSRSRPRAGRSLPRRASSSPPCCGTRRPRSCCAAPMPGGAGSSRRRGATPFAPVKRSTRTASVRSRSASAIRTSRSQPAARSRSTTHCSPTASARSCRSASTGWAVSAATARSAGSRCSEARHRRLDRGADPRRVPVGHAPDRPAQPNQLIPRGRTAWRYLPRARLRDRRRQGRRHQGRRAIVGAHRRGMPLNGRSAVGSTSATCEAPTE